MHLAVILLLLIGLVLIGVEAVRSRSALAAGVFCVVLAFALPTLATIG